MGAGGGPAGEAQGPESGGAGTSPSVAGTERVGGAWRPRTVGLLGRSSEDAGFYLKCGQRIRAL